MMWRSRSASSAPYNNCSYSIRRPGTEGDPLHPMDFEVPRPPPDPYGEGAERVSRGGTALQNESVCDILDTTRVCIKEWAA